jgi:5-methyltetrahydrofolate--homocysteine methyltransferase
MASDLTTLLSSKTKGVSIQQGRPTDLIGERINPTGRKQMLAALQAGNFDQVRGDAQAQILAGAVVLTSTAASQAPTRALSWNR